MTAGASIPPTAAARGDMARRGDASAPPGSVASNTSFAASAKKNTIPISLAQKCSGPAMCSYVGSGAPTLDPLPLYLRRPDTAAPKVPKRVS